ncbi:MAG: putative ABC transporter permease subunit [Bdellovibrionota bacterium]
MKIFLAIKPRILELLNSIKQKIKTPKGFGRDFFLIFIASLLLYATFKGTLFLANIFSVPFFPLNMIFTMLFALILFSGAIISINEFFVSKDLSVYLTSPISNFNFYIGKIIITVFTASWMPSLLLIPILLAFGVHYNQGLIYYLLFPLVVLPILAIPIFIGNIAVFILAKLIPLKVFKEVLFFFYITMFLLVGIFVKNLFTLKFDNNISGNINGIEAASSLSSYMPFEWGAIFLNNLLKENSISLNYFLLLYIVFFTLLFISYLVFKKYYFISLNAAHSFSSAKTHRVKILENAIYKITNFLGTARQEILLKEYKTFLRNIGQSSQIFLLLGIVFLYFSNLRFITTLSSLNNIYMAIISLGVCTFILIAFCSRFVFPSLSLEAKAYDIFLQSPISLRLFYNSKKLFWFVFLSLISTTIFIATSLALSLSPIYIFANFFIGLIFSYGLINIAMFVGSSFLKLNWKNPYELCSSVGSLCTMLLSICYLIIFSILIYYLFDYISLNYLPLKLTIILLGVLFLNILLSNILTNIGFKNLKQKIS